MSTLTLTLLGIVYDLIRCCVVIMKHRGMSTLTLTGVVCDLIRCCVVIEECLPLQGVVSIMNFHIRKKHTHDIYAKSCNHHDVPLGARMHEQEADSHTYA